MFCARSGFEPGGCRGLSRRRGVTGVGEAPAGPGIEAPARRRPSVPAPVLVLGSAVSTQTGSALAKGLFPAVGPPGVLLLRLVFGALLVAIVTRPRLHGWTRQQAPLAAALGTTIVGVNFTFYEALDRASLGITVGLQFTGPLMVAILGSRHRVDLLWAGFAGAGVALLALGAGEHELEPLGLVFALSGGVCWALFIVLGAHVGRVFPDNAGLFPAMAFAAVLVMPPGILVGGRELLDGDVLLRGIAIGALSAAVPWTLELSTLRRVPPRVFGVIISLTPAVAALSGLVFLGERLSRLSWLALGFIIVASAGASTKQEAGAR